jgi:hypothetical protein
LTGNRSAVILIPSSRQKQSLEKKLKELRKSEINPLTSVWFCDILIRWNIKKRKLSGT